MQAARMSVVGKDNIYMIKTLLLALAAVAAAVTLLCVRIIFVKGGKFPNLHVGGNEHLRRKGISCAQSQHNEAQSKQLLTPARMEEILRKKENKQL